MLIINSFYLNTCTWNYFRKTNYFYGPSLSMFLMNGHISMFSLLLTKANFLFFSQPVTDAFLDEEAITKWDLVLEEANPSLQRVESNKKGDKMRYFCPASVQ